MYAWKQKFHVPTLPVQQLKMQEIWNPFSQAKLPYFKGIFNLWTHEQQELPFLQMFITFANQNLAVLRPWNGFCFFLEFLMLYKVYGNMLDGGYPKTKDYFFPS